MNTLPVHELQRINESMYARAHIDGYIRAEVQLQADLQAKHHAGVQQLTAWLNGTYYASKNARLDQVKHLDLDDLVTEVFVQAAYCLKPTLFTAVSAQLAARLGFNDRREALVTTAEILAVVCLTDAYDITKQGASASLMLESRMNLPAKLVDFIQHSEVLPPMVCPPQTLQHNRQSPHLTVGADSLILGKGNHHEGDICLDVINTLNQQALKLDTAFLSTVEEEPTFDLDTPEKARLWQDFKAQSYHFYDLMVHQGNRFYMPWKVDKRGRLYAQGYHINPQGTAFKKAMIELADEEVVDGVPEQYQRHT